MQAKEGARRPLFLSDASFRLASRFLNRVDELRAHRLFEELKRLPKERIPHRVDITPDGTRRGARRLGRVPIEGIDIGISKIVHIARPLRALHIGELWLWVYSEDNWDGRPIDERDYIMEHVEQGIKDHIGELDENNVQLAHFGRKDRLQENYSSLMASLDNAETRTARNTGQKVKLVIDFGTAKRRYTEEELEAVGVPDLWIRTAEPRTSGWPIGPQTTIHLLRKPFTHITILDVLQGVDLHASTQVKEGT